MDYEIKYLNCLCLKGTTVSRFITNACLQLFIVIQLLVWLVILIEYSSLVRIITYYNLYLNDIHVWLNDNSIVKKSCILLSSIANNKYDYKVYRSFRPPQPRRSCTCTNCIDNRIIIIIIIRIFIHTRSTQILITTFYTQLDNTDAKIIK